jgi:hypothetical protein
MVILCCTCFLDGLNAVDIKSLLFFCGGKLQSGIYWRLWCERIYLGVASPIFMASNKRFVSKYSAALVLLLLQPSYTLRDLFTVRRRLVPRPPARQMHVASTWIILAGRQIWAFSYINTLCGQCTSLTEYCTSFYAFEKKSKQSLLSPLI